MNPLLIDTHCHLNDLRAFPDPAETLRFAAENGVTRVLVVGIHPESCRYAVELAERFENVHAILGLHPNHAAEHSDEVMRELDGWMSHPKVVALGEIGLDYHWDYATPEQQRFSLREQLDLARKHGKPVVFHCREAYPDLLTILEKEPAWPYLLHCFAGSADDAQRALALGMMFGVDGPITYKKADDLRAIFASLPRDRVVIETDSPYMTPVPFRGKPNQPAYVRYVNEDLAELWGISAAECAVITSENADRFFGL